MSTAFDAWVERARATPIEREIERRGIKLNGGSFERDGPCPVCGGDDRFSINIKKQVWNCRGCARGGDVISLVEHLDGVGFLAGECLHDNILTLRYWRGGWWMCKTTHWVEIDDGAVRSILYRFTERAFYLEGIAPRPWAPNKHKIGNLIDALTGICLLPVEVDQPCWLDDELAINGTLTVNRKYRDQWSGKLPTRLHVLSNELPKLGDASTAIVGRIVLLLTTRSWLGREDLTLEPALRGELTGILNWALDGLQRLTVTNENCFTRVPAADEAVTAMRDLASPVQAFVREQCEIKADHEILVDELYAAYRGWADQNGHSKKAKETFGRDLRAAIPSISVKRPRDHGDRRRIYVGIAMRHD